MATVELRTIGQCTARRCMGNIVYSHVSKFFTESDCSSCEKRYQQCKESDKKMTFPCKNAFSECYTRCSDVQETLSGTASYCNNQCDADKKMCNMISVSVLDNYICLKALKLCRHQKHCHRIDSDDH